MKKSKTQTIVLSSLYFSGILSYNIFTLYSNSIEQLIEYRKTKQIFKNELDAVVSGCQKNWFDNLLLSLFWPIRLPFTLIPIVILYFNSNESNENDSFIKYEFKKCINIKNINKTIDKIKNDSPISKESVIEITEIVKDTVDEIIDNIKEDIPINKIKTTDEVLEDLQKDNLKFNFGTINEELIFDFSLLNN